MMAVFLFSPNSLYGHWAWLLVCSPYSLPRCSVVANAIKVGPTWHPWGQGSSLPGWRTEGLNPTGSQSHWEEAAVIPIMPA